MSNFVKQAAELRMYWQASGLAGVVSVLVVNIRVRGMTVKWALCVCVWVARGVRVNWCCVLKVVNKAGEHPSSSCEMHTNTHTVAQARVRQINSTASV